MVLTMRGERANSSAPSAPVRQSNLHMTFTNCAILNLLVGLQTMEQDIPTESIVGLSLSAPLAQSFLGNNADLSRQRFSSNVIGKFIHIGDQTVGRYPLISSSLDGFAGRRTCGHICSYTQASLHHSSYTLKK